MAPRSRSDRPPRRPNGTPAWMYAAIAVIGVVAVVLVGIALTR